MAPWQLVCLLCAQAVMTGTSSRLRHTPLSSLMNAEDDSPVDASDGFQEEERAAEEADDEEKTGEDLDEQVKKPALSPKPGQEETWSDKLLRQFEQSDEIASL